LLSISFVSVEVSNAHPNVLSITVYDNEKENWRILTNKQFYAVVKNLP
jgi:hypothetical protein